MSKELHRLLKSEIMPESSSMQGSADDAQLRKENLTSNRYQHRSTRGRSLANTCSLGLVALCCIDAQILGNHLSRTLTPCTGVKSNTSFSITPSSCLVSASQRFVSESTHMRRHMSAIRKATYSRCVRMACTIVSHHCMACAVVHMRHITSAYASQY